MNADYDVLGVEHGSITLEISLPDGESFEHHLSVESVQRHDDGPAAGLEAAVRDVAAQWAAQGLGREDLPDGGTVEFEPSDRGQPEQRRGSS